MGTEDWKEIRRERFIISLLDSLVPSSSWMNGEWVCECWLKWVWCSCVYIHPLIHHYPLPPNFLLAQLISYPPLPLFFSPHTLPLSLSYSLSRSLTTPSHWFRGFSWGRKLTSCWASVTHFVQPWPASVDTAGHFKGGAGPTMPF